MMSLSESWTWATETRSPFSHCESVTWVAPLVTVGLQLQEISGFWKQLCSMTGMARPNFMLMRLKSRKNRLQSSRTFLKRRLVTTDRLTVHHCMDTNPADPAAPKEAPTGQAGRDGKDIQIHETSGVTEESVRSGHRSLYSSRREQETLFLYGLY
jgi:hypothetical protein